MLPTITVNHTGHLMWSPDHDKFAYITQTGLHAYINGKTDTADKYYVMLAEGRFDEIGWSPDGAYLTAKRPDQTQLIFRFHHQTVQLTHSVQATSLEWLHDNQLIYVPENGGLVMVYLGKTPTEVRLAG